MCIKCHQVLSNERVNTTIQEELNNKNKNFSIYNSTSISHIIIASSEFNGFSEK